jgi:hypothetical protein
MATEPRKRTKIITRNLAGIFGALLTFVQLGNISHVRVPTNGEAVGYDFVWILVLAAGVYMLLYAFGLKGAKKNCPEVPHD